MYDVNKTIKEHWPYRSEKIKDKQAKELRRALRYLYVDLGLDYMHVHNYLEYILNEPMTLRHLEETCKKVGATYAIQCTR